LKKGLKVLIALGGWNDSEGDKYSRLVASPQARSRFITHAMDFIESYGFDGLDLDWEYPKCWQVGSDTDTRKIASRSLRSTAIEVQMRTRKTSPNSSRNSKWPSSNWIDNSHA